MHGTHLTGRARGRLAGRHALWLALVLSAWGCRSAPRAYRFERDAMGTQFRISVFSERDEASVRAAAAAAFERIEALDASASDWRADSELSQIPARLFASPGKEFPASITISKELAALFQLSAEMRDRSGGRFDPALGRASKLWRRAQRQGEFPEASLLHDLLEEGPVPWSIRGRELSLEEPFAGPAPRFDLGAVAKGAALDHALSELENRGLPCALVEGGGDVVCGAPPPGTKGWRIEMAPGRAFEAVDSGPLFLCNAAVATSGTHSRGGVIDQIFRSHLVDSETSAPLGEDGRQLASCVIVSRDEFPNAGARADALATVLCLVPDEERTSLLLNSADFSARTWSRGLDLETRLQEGPTFQAFVVMSPPSRNPRRPR